MQGTIMHSWGQIYSFWIFILNNSAIWLVNTKPQIKQMYCQILPRRMCNPCGYTMKINSRYLRLLIFDVKRTTKIDGMGPFKLNWWYKKFIFKRYKFDDQGHDFRPRY